IEELSGEVEDLVLFGGGAKGKLIREIFVNVLAKPLFVFPYPDMPLIGVSLLAGIVTGIFRDYKEIIPLIRKKASLIEPEIRKIEIYGELYMEYLEIQSKLL
ncbi:MAG: hypothetical protein ACP5RW_09930, partial [bacterium]